MFVGQTMSHTVITVDPGASLSEAVNKLTDHHIRHLPVVDENERLVGIITDRDLRSALPSAYMADNSGVVESKHLLDKTVREVMTPNPKTILTSATLPDALLQIQKFKVGALPVVDADGCLKGIISVRDLLRAFINVMGIGEPGTLLCILVEEKIGQMKKIVDAITEENISIGSILVARYWDEDKRAVFPYLLTLSVASIKKKLEALGFSILDPMQWWLDQLPKTE